MENISISSYSAQLRIYSGAAGPPKPKLAQTSSGTSSEPASDLSLGSQAGSAAGACDVKNKDGDSFSLSLEARIVQISMTRSDDGVQDWSGKDAGGSQGDASKSSGAQAVDSQSGGSFGSGLVKALMQAVGLMGKDAASATGQTNGQGADDGASNPEALRSGGGRHRHHHPHMGNPEDVASKVLQHLQQEHASKGGDLQAFVDQVQKRMENRKGSSGGNSDGSADFRNQVDSLITSGLTAWAQTGGASVNVQA